MGIKEVLAGEIRAFRTVVEEEEFCLRNLREVHKGSAHGKILNAVPLSFHALISAVVYYPMHRITDSPKRIIAESEAYIAELPINRETIKKP